MGHQTQGSVTGDGCIERTAVPALARGRAELTDPRSLLPAAESSLVGGTVSLAARAIAAGETEKLPELLPDLADFILSPYSGRSARPRSLPPRPFEPRLTPDSFAYRTIPS